MSYLELVSKVWDVIISIVSTAYVGFLRLVVLFVVYIWDEVDFMNVGILLGWLLFYKNFRCGLAVGGLDFVVLFDMNFGRVLMVFGSFTVVVLCNPDVGS